VPSVNFYRAIQKKTPEGIAEAVALTFMGVRLSSMAEKKKNNLYTFFKKVGYKRTAEWKEEIVYYKSDTISGLMGSEVMKTYVFPDGSSVKIGSAGDPRKVFADWLISDTNKWFSKNAVNRIWFRLLGKGIIHEPDDIRSDNPASVPELLSFLEKEFVENEYNIRQIYKVILNSSVYQLSSIPLEPDNAGEYVFAYYKPRQLEAEVIIDMICRLTGTAESYYSEIPEPFTFVPQNQRTVSLFDASITSPFLELYGRPSRDKGYELERNNTPASSQKLHLLNSSHIQKKIYKSKKLKKILKKDGSEVVDYLYLSVFSRFPTAEEKEKVKLFTDSYRKIKGTKGMDVFWAMVNTKEFITRH
jgi:hypothetical protein